ncbi:hypothetical protein ABH931_001300 [Streptacidiphilus sp. MAP12-33]|uniref:hypothetical protein n=1 Tax=Streptacidiphilus sp. MAP12-33 TaxID=3156266 RepID=UPI0035127A43
MSRRRVGAVVAGAIAAGALAVLPVSAAQAAQAAPAPACAGAARSNPVAVTLGGVRSAYPVGGPWTSMRLTLRNRTRAVCGRLDPVLVYGARNRTLRRDAVRLETLTGNRWRAVPLRTALGELTGAVGPAQGLRLRPGASVTLTVRMRFTRSAPRGQWLSLAVAYAPMEAKGTSVDWPVGVTNPAYFRVVPARRTHRAA